jgi:succinyl-CoA synthetase beta subunit
MNIHEYQGKALLKTFGAPVAEGVAGLLRRAKRKPPPSRCQARSTS